jgi:dTDP-4-amino-4,6-dideoxygalactose transaminase
MAWKRSMDWRVRFVDYPRAFGEIEADMMPKLRSVLAGGDLMMRQDMVDFEHALAAFVGTSDAVGVSNCTDGLRLTLEALSVGTGDEVITVAHTFVATMAAIHHVGATPIFVDVGSDHNIDVEQVESAITTRTRAIIPVHLNGRVCSMDRLMDVANRHDLLVVEDAAQALGASFRGINAGAWGIAGVFSFYPAKILGAYGDAGAVVSNDHELASRLRALRDHGRISKRDTCGWGWNCRLDNLQAAALNVKLPRLPAWIERRRHLASLYDDRLDGVLQVKRPAGPGSGGGFHDVYQNYVVEAERRDGLVRHLTERGVECLISWPVPMHHQPLGLQRWSLPRTEALADAVVSLPLMVELDDEQVLYVANCIREFYG